MTDDQGGGSAIRSRTGASRRARLASGNPAAGVLTAMLDGIEDAAVALDGNGLVLVANASAVRLLRAKAGAPLAVPGALGVALAGPEPAFELDHGDRRLQGRRIVADGHVVWYVRDITEQVVRTDALLAERWRSAFLAEAGRRLGGSLNVARTARTTALLAVPVLADSALVILPGTRTHLDWFRVDDAPDAELGAGTLHRGDLAADSPIGQALDGLTVPDDPRLAETLGGLLADGFGEIGSAMVVPLPGYAAAAGALVLARRAGRADFEPAEVHLAQQFAARAGTALAAAALYADQAYTADVLQRSLEVPELPAIPGAVLGGTYRPAREQLRIGGDFFDVFPDPDGGWMFLLGDVCGKGIEAAAQTGRTRQTVHALRLLEPRPLRLLELLNAASLNADRSDLVTLVVGSLRRIDGGLHVTLATGGHPAPLLVRAGGGTEPVAVRGMAVGMVPEAQFGETDVVLAPGDMLVAYTDGVTEARGGAGGREFFGERLLAEVDAYRGAPAQVMAERIAQRASEWARDGLQDDVAVLVVQAAA
ncbi:PP2C family protein-serine/threonine phosphatase [Hamadaea tsunoensis]|uniref:PP2C family protein-serine/threonine phosphatase n=1 Tax=Hamadaea tsunoensis TaxID=53368 RepID=UPI000400A613|nr:PP2C family protein-serine/threonine phosphatase [Hamadaea tsunoensis]